MTGPTYLTEAEARYLDEVRADCARLLGPGVQVDGPTIAHEEGATILRLTYRMGPTRGESEGRGETAVAAHASLRARLVEDRIAFAMWAYIDATTRY